MQSQTDVPGRFDARVDASSWRRILRRCNPRRVCQVISTHRDGPHCAHFGVAIPNGRARSFRQAWRLYVRYDHSVATPDGRARSFRRASLPTYGPEIQDLLQSQMGVLGRFDQARPAALQTTKIKVATPDGSARPFQRKRTNGYGALAHVANPDGYARSFRPHSPGVGHSEYARLQTQAGAPGRFD